MRAQSRYASCGARVDSGGKQRCCCKGVRRKVEVHVGGGEPSHAIDTYEHKTQRQDKRCLEIYNKEQIERNVSLDTKLSVILPEILSVKSPKGSSRVWDDFKQLGDIRDRIIHMKSGDRKSSGPDEKTIWNTIFASVSPPHQVAKEILNFFLKSKGTLPTWLEHAPS